MIDLLKPFGKTIIDNFKKGDLVCWSEWRVIDGNLTKETHYGIFAGKESEFFGLREVLFGLILCSETGQEIRVLAVRLRIPETN